MLSFTCAEPWSPNYLEYYRPYEQTFTTELTGNLVPNQYFTLVPLK